MLIRCLNKTSKGNLKKGASKKKIEKIELKLKDKIGVDVMKYCGLIKLHIDALTIQKTLRDEWK